MECTTKALSIREARKLAGLTQEDLGRLVGLPQVLISYTEQGRVGVLEKDRPTWEWALNAAGRINWGEQS